uniref:Uncharacterized protein n=1 Tax=Arundo donax TaxID=35708 RepID=A0A0A8XRD5_ARUDO
MYISSSCHIAHIHFWFLHEDPNYKSITSGSLVFFSKLSPVHHTHNVLCNILQKTRAKDITTFGRQT